MYLRKEVFYNIFKIQGYFLRQTLFHLKACIYLKNELQYPLNISIFFLNANYNTLVNKALFTSQQMTKPHSHYDNHYFLDVFMCINIHFHFIQNQKLENPKRCPYLYIFLPNKYMYLDALKFPKQKGMLSTELLISSNPHQS